MNQEPNNNLENTQTTIDNTQTNIQSAPVNIENTQTTVQMSPVSEATEELNLGDSASETAETIQPAMAPTVTVSTPIQDEKIEVVEGDTKIEVSTKPHDVPIPDETNKKDFVIKSKKETVAADVKAREKKIEEHQKQANENYKPNSKFTTVLLVIFFVVLIGFAWFLPQIRLLISKWQSGELKPVEEVKITNGTLNCTYNRSSNELDYEYEVDFVFSNNSLESYDKATTVKGDASLDKETLDKLKENCNIMKKESNNIPGLVVSCNTDTNKVKTTEKLELNEFSTDSITAAYTEAGGEYPEYTFEQDMDDIEKNMKAAGFTCDRTAR